MSVLHPSPRKERNQTPIHRIIATITSFNCHFLLNLKLWSYCSTVWGWGGRLGSFLFVSFFLLCVRMLWSDIWHEHKVLDVLVDFHQWDGENITVLGNILYNNGLIFFIPRESFFQCFPSFYPVSLSLAIDGFLYSMQTMLQVYFI